MPDIAMCMNEDCPLKENCYRYKAKPNEYWQSYGDFKPDINIELDEVECKYYIPLGNQNNYL